MNYFRKVHQEVYKNGWRHTIYERLDGSRFHVSLPPTTQEGGRFHNEYDEMEMALKMYQVKDKGYPCSTA